MAKRLNPIVKVKRSLIRQLNTQINRIGGIMQDMEKIGYTFSESKLRDMYRLNTDKATIWQMKKSLKRLKGITKTDLYGYVKEFNKINWKTGEGEIVKGNESAVIAGKREERRIWKRERTTRREQADEAIGIITSVNIEKYYPGKYEGSKYTLHETANLYGLKNLIVTTYMSLRDTLTKRQLEKIREAVDDLPAGNDSDQELIYSNILRDLYTLITNKSLPIEYTYIEDAISPESTPAEKSGTGWFSI